MNIVAIVGRPNVGKSTLFNRIIGTRNAIIEEASGVTRDRLYGGGEWAGKHFTLIDTGGIVPNSEEVFEKSIREQALIAIEEADSIIFVCDGKVGVTELDLEIADILRRTKKRVTLAINKCDEVQFDSNVYDFYTLGLGEPFGFSALNGRSIGEMLDNATETLENATAPEEDTRLKVAVVGRPNAGKSSLVNALLGEDRMIVTPIAGTTRDAIDSILRYHGEEIVLIDTAGLRRKSRIKENIELYSTIRTQRAIERCDVAVVVVDASVGIEAQDKTIINDVVAARKGLCIAFNKWDTVEKDHKTAEAFMRSFQEDMASVDYAPMLFISAETKQRIIKVVELCREIKERRSTRISTSKLNDALLSAIEATPPPSVRGRDLRINYITQVRTEPPVFAFFSNHPELIPDNYKRFIERQLRELYDFRGVPVSFIFKRKNVKREYN